METQVENAFSSDALAKAFIQNILQKTSFENVNEAKRFIDAIYYRRNQGEYNFVSQWVSREGGREWEVRRRERKRKGMGREGEGEGDREGEGGWVWGGRKEVGSKRSEQTAATEKVWNTMCCL